MRAFMAPAICVYLTGGWCAQGAAMAPAMPQDNTGSQVSSAAWVDLYRSAVAAGLEHRDEEAVGLFERCWSSSANDEERGLAADGFAEVARRLDRISEAKEWLGRARQAFSTAPRLSRRLAIVISNLADLDRTTGDYRSAELVLRQMADSPTPDDESRAFVRNNLADLLREEGKTEEARQLFSQTSGAPALSARIRAAALVGLADIDRQQSAWESSIRRWNEVLEVSQREHDDAMQAVALRGLGSTWLQAGDAGRAEPLLRRSIKLIESNPGMPSEEVASAHSALAELYRSQNKLALAQNEWSRALEIDQPLLGGAHPQVAILLEMLSDVYSARGEFNTAIGYASKASQAMSSSFGEDSMPVAAALTNQASVEQRANDLPDAARHFEQAIRIARLYPEHRTLQMTMLERYAGLLKIMHRTREAKALLAERHALLAQNSAVPVK